MQCNPLNILEVSRNNATVASMIEYWKHGHLSWERAMMLAVCVLADQNNRLLETATKAEMLKIPTPIQVGDNKFVYTGPCPLCGQSLKGGEL
jgi:hypothetical protein